MATGVLVSEEEYPRTSYRPDCDYVDGEVVERNLGEYEHGSTQRADSLSNSRCLRNRGGCTAQRINEYLGMGVPTCWIIDPVRREGWVATPGRLEEATDGTLRASGIEMPLTEVLE
jgi:hypothetical protein